MADHLPVMAERAFKSGLRWGSLLIAATAACLPQGPPPAGRQVVPGRGAALGTLVPPNGDGMLRILVLRPGATSDSVDLSVVALDESNEPSPEVPLLSDLDPIFGVGCGIYGREPCSVDASGTVQALRTDGSWVLVNAITGEVLDPRQGPSGPVYTYKTPGGRSFQPDPATANTLASGTLTDSDGHTTRVDLLPSSPFGVPVFQFFGEDFYYLDPQQNLIDIPPSDIPQQRATGVLQFKGSTTPDGAVLIVTRASSSSVLDAQGTETALPFDASTAEVSKDGRWVLDTKGQSAGRFTFYDYRSGVQQTVQIDGSVIDYDWRPGTSEIWMTVFAGPNDQHAVWILRPDAPAVSVPGAYQESINLGGSFVQRFTDDGVYWFFTTTSLDSATEVVQVGRGDDPTGPAYPLNPPSTFLNRVLPMQDGRFLTTAYVKDEDRSDVTVVDPSNGQAEVLARRGFFLTPGRSRFMGLFHMAEARGDLTTVALQTGQVSVLAHEFAVTAAAEPQNGDALAPGTRIVYQFQARTASPYDGIWVTNCP